MIKLVSKTMTALLVFCLATPSWAIPVESLAKNCQSEDQFITADGVKLHYVEGGSGHPVVLLHGNDGTLQDFTMSIFDQLASQYQTIAFDRPGHGTSERPAHEIATPAVQAHILHSALSQMGMARPILVAHSWSGAMALSYALQFPNDLSGVVLLGGVAYETKEGAPKPIYYAARLPIVGNILALLFKFTGRHEIEKQLEEAFNPDPTPKAYKRRFLSSLFRSSQLKAAACDEITLNPTLKQISPQYGKIALPVVIVVGDHDKTVPAHLHSYRLHKDIAQSQLIVVRNAGHELQFTRPQEVIKAIALALSASQASSPVLATNQALRPSIEQPSAVSR